MWLDDYRRARPERGWWLTPVPVGALGVGRLFVGLTERVILSRNDPSGAGLQTALSILHLGLSCIPLPLLALTQTCTEWTLSTNCSSKCSGPLLTLPKRTHTLQPTDCPSSMVPSPCPLHCCPTIAFAQHCPPIANHDSSPLRRPHLLRHRALGLRDSVAFQRSPSQDCRSRPGTAPSQAALPRKKRRSRQASRQGRGSLLLLACF